MLSRVALVRTDVSEECGVRRIIPEDTILQADRVRAVEMMKGSNCTHFSEK
jgi:hypothetical protein